MSTRPIFAVALDGAGAHPAAPVADPAALLTGEWIARQVLSAEQAGIDLVTLDDGPDLPGLAGRLDPLLALTRAAASTERIGLVPTLATTHHEPFHLTSELATLDFVSQGRAGWRVQVATTEAEAALIGRRPAASAEPLWREAGQVADLAQQLWDSWQDDAVIRDVSSGRFVDRDRLHYTNFRGVDSVGATFTVKGPSIVPRPPQGHPVITVRVDPDQLDLTLDVIARWADLVIVDSAVPATAHRALRRIREVAAGRPLRVLADLSVVLAGSSSAAYARLAALNSGPTPATIDFVGTGPALARHIDLLVHNGFDGVHLRPAVIGVDTEEIYRTVRPQHGPPPTGRSTLRHTLGLARPANRHTDLVGATT